MKFTKMQGCGNDYIYVNCFEESIDDFSKTAVAVSDRHFGIGSDGLICICPSQKADFRMRIFNADGSEGQMCGNGIRCVAKYVYDHHMTDQTVITVETLAGIKKLTLFPENGKVKKVTVNMGSPIFDPEKIPACIPNCKDSMLLQEPVTVSLEGEQTTNLVNILSMGNPHAVIRTESVEAVSLEKIGPLYENHSYFPERINTEFIEVLDRGNIRMRVWERGAGETLACGTGSCASVVTCVKNGWTDEHVTVHLLGGDLEIFYDQEENTVWMTGPAVTVCSGEIDLNV